MIEALDALRLRGVRVAADAVGAGYADLDRILHLHPDIVKLDVALIRDVDSDPVRRALCGAMVAFAAEIGVVTIAEGIETAAELEVLRGLGVPWGQGHFLGRPGGGGGGVVCESGSLSREGQVSPGGGVRHGKRHHLQLD